MLVRNDSPNAVLILRRHRLGTVTEVMDKNCFQAVLDLEAAGVPPKLISDHFNCRLVAISSADPSLETKLPNGVMIYGEEKAVQRIVSLVDKLTTIWDSSSFVDISPERWMTVPLKDDWHAKLTNIKPKVYSLGVEARDLVNETFDKLQQQGRLLYT